MLGVSTQTTDYQREMAGRLQLPYDVLSDAGFRLTEALHLPTFEAGGMRLLRRLTLLVRGGVIEACFYPVFPPDADAEHVIAWLREHADPGFRLREATVADIPLIARHRAAMFRDMGRLAAEREAELVGATADYLREALPRGEYLGWVAQTDQSPPETIGGAGVQLRPILPRPDVSGEGVELGPEAIVLNVYVDPAWRRHGVGEALMRSLLDTLAHRRIRRIVLHASDQGRRLYERLGFLASNEMRLERP